MKITQNGNHEVVAIDFCCGQLANDLLMGRLKCRPFTDHVPRFYLETTPTNGSTQGIGHCYYCGEKIEGKF